MAGIKVYSGDSWEAPIATKVYINGQWVEKTGKVLINGSWVEFTTGGGSITPDPVILSTWTINKKIVSDGGYFYIIPYAINDDKVTKLNPNGTAVYSNQALGSGSEWASWTVKDGYFYGSYEMFNASLGYYSNSSKVNASSLTPIYNVTAYDGANALTGAIETYNVTSNDTFTFAHGREATYVFRNDTGECVVTPNLHYSVNRERSKKIITTKSATADSYNYEYFAVMNSSGNLFIYRYSDISSPYEGWYNSYFPSARDWEAGNGCWYGVDMTNRRVIKLDLMGQTPNTVIGDVYGANYVDMTVSESNEIYVVCKTDDYYTPSNSCFELTKYKEGQKDIVQKISFDEMKEIRQVIAHGDGYLYILYEKPNDTQVYMKKIQM